REQRRGGLRQPLAEGDRRLSEPLVRHTARRLALGPREELEPMREVELEDGALEVSRWSALEEGETLHHGGIIAKRRFEAPARLWRLRLSGGAQRDHERLGELALRGLA